MPLYGFACDQCAHRADEFDLMKNSVPVGDYKVCPVCGHLAYRRQADQTSTDLKEFHTPIEMQSVAATSWAEIRQIQENCPDVRISDNPEDELFGVPIVKNRKEKSQVLKTTGFMETN